MMIAKQGLIFMIHFRMNERMNQLFCYSKLIVCGQQPICMPWLVEDESFE
jgi:hypothetical protein